MNQVQNSTEAGAGQIRAICLKHPYGECEPRSLWMTTRESGVQSITPQNGEFYVRMRTSTWRIDRSDVLIVEYSREVAK